jgi:predicted nucleic-acid-binding Zn-ribbon protein
MNKPHRCPKCGSKNVAYMSIAWDSHNKKRIVGTCCCHDCDTHFKEHYLTDYQGSEIYEYDPWDGPMSAPVTFGTLEALK